MQNNDVEKHRIALLRQFNSKPTLELFKTFDDDAKMTIIQSGMCLIDDIFKSLPKELINEYISQGPNLTTYQANELPVNLIKRYIERRAISIPQLLSNWEYKYNKLDQGNSTIKQKIQI